MPKHYSIAEASDNLTRMIHEVQQETRINITHEGDLVAVLLSVREYERLAEARIDFMDVLVAFRARFDLEELGIDDSTFEGVRDRSPGRDMQW